MSTLAAILENSSGCAMGPTVLDGPASDDPGEAANLAIHEAIEP